MNKNCNFYALLFFLAPIGFACAQDRTVGPEIITPKSQNYTVETVIDGMEIPWGMVFLPDGSLLVTEKKGELIHLKEGKKTKVEGLPKVTVQGQGGLMDIILHPDYEKNGWLYLSYASSEGEGEGANTAIARAKLENNRLTGLQVLYKASPNSTRGQHFGSRMVFDDEGYLYFSIGDRGDNENNPQDISRDGGKVYRIHDDGTIPKDNPFVNKSNAKTAIFSYGHRNPQGMILHPDSREVWVHEHGPRGGDEINIVKKAANYGWPVITYGINYNGTEITDQRSKPGMEQPLYYWLPSIAPSGFAVLSGDVYPEWKGDLLIGSLKFSYLEKLTLKNNKVVKREKLMDGVGRVRNVIIGPDGLIYAGLDGQGIVRLVPKK
ncbi:MAG TPA: PQQ-dependent sugar dehydrogenase [Cyclobacteriaceae bacterium]|nr:PQQ-dependent sugar dehydrogenase [Cyclobacteriaceae bacterium]